MNEVLQMLLAGAPAATKPEDLLWLGEQYFFREEYSEAVTTFAKVAALAPSLLAFIALVWLGDMARDGLGMPADPLAARQFFTQAAGGDQVVGGSALGRSLLDAAQGPVDFGQARRLLKVAAAAGNPHATVTYKVMVDNGCPSASTEAEKKEAEAWYRLAASKCPGGVL